MKFVYYMQKFLNPVSVSIWVTSDQSTSMTFFTEAYLLNFLKFLFNFGSSICRLNIA